MTDTTTHKPTREQINAMRLKAFASNNHDDRMAYYKACSGWFQDEDFRELERAAERDALAAQLAAAEARAREASLDALAAYGQAADAHAAQLAAEAKLATARADALEEAARVCDGYDLAIMSTSQADYRARTIAAAIRALANGES